VAARRRGRKSGSDEKRTLNCDPFRSRPCIGVVVREGDGKQERSTPVQSEGLREFILGDMPLKLLSVRASTGCLLAEMQSGCRTRETSSLVFFAVVFWARTRTLVTAISRKDAAGAVLQGRIEGPVTRLSDAINLSAAAGESCWLARYGLEYLGTETSFVE
jgi:hypothetical protein